MVFENWKKNGLEIAAASDMHVHLRDGDMMELVVPTIRHGGVNQVMVMVSTLRSFDEEFSALADYITA